MKNSKKWSIISLAIGILIFSAYFASSGHIPGLKSSALGSDFMCTQEGVERYMQQYDEDVAQRASLTTDVERLQLKNESLSQEIQTLQSNIQSGISQKEITQNTRQIRRRQNTIHKNQRRITKIQVRIDQSVARINAYESCKALLSQEFILPTETTPTTDAPIDEAENQIVSNNENTISHNSASSVSVNGGWIDNDISSATLYVAQKSCTNPAPANGGENCVTPAGWQSFYYRDTLYARSCINGGINGRWLPYENIQAYWCDPPAGYAPTGYLLPFNVHVGEVGLMQRSPNTWNIDWSSVPGGHWWVNNTGRTLVIRDFTFGYDIRGSALRNADTDVCMAVSTGPGWPIVEAACINQWIGPSGGQWITSNKKIDFPGRGIVLLPGGAFHCDAQIVGREAQNVPMASVLACDFSVYDAQDPTIKHLHAYQTIRAPYFDEFTYTGYSQDTAHVNLTNNYLHVNGAWIYASTRVRPVDVCLKHHKAGVGVDAQSCFTHSGVSDTNRYSSNVDFANFYVGFYPQDGVSAQCTPTPGATPLSPGESIDCAFYMMLSVHEDKNGLHPLRMSQTVTPSWREHYCKTLLFSGDYINTDPSRGNYEACISILSH